MLEIEVKVPCPDLEGIADRLKAMGARDFGRLMQTDVYYSHPARDFGETDEALRVRTENDIVLVTYKGPKLDPGSKTREELEVTVGNAATFDEMLQRLDFRPVLRVAKQRNVYGIRGISVCLDRVEGLGDYVELEFEGEGVEEGMARIMSLKEELGLEGNERLSYLELLLKKNRMQGIGGAGRP